MLSPVRCTAKQTAAPRLLALMMALALAGCASQRSLYGPPGYSAGNTTQSCVPYARQVSGIDLRGNAYRWWREAAGIYPRARSPRIGAVLVLKPHGAMSVGHVAVVTAIESKREIRVTQANWLPDRVEHGVPVEDVSVRNNWSYVRMWYAPINGWGETIYPAYGFILPN